MGFGLIIAFVFILGFLFSTFKVLQEYERAVIFRLGRVLGEPKGPGVIVLFPIIDRMVRISTRTITMDIEPQDVISRDNVTLKVTAVLYFKVVDPTRAVINIENYLYATSQLSQTHLRSTLGEHTLDQLLTERETINAQLQKIMDQNTASWGIKVVACEVKHIDLPPDMQRAMAKQAEAERERRAKVIAAEGEFEASAKLKDAADMISQNPTTIQLRYLQTLSSMAAEEKSSTIIFPIPIEMFKAFMPANK